MKTLSSIIGVIDLAHASKQYKRVLILARVMNTSTIQQLEVCRV